MSKTEPPRGTFIIGSGLPETPVYLAATPGTAFTGFLRPDRTTQSLVAASVGSHLNSAAYATPQAGLFGDAGCNSIEGPSQFTFNASLQRTFRLPRKFYLDVRLNGMNILNPRHLHHLEHHSQPRTVLAHRAVHL